MKAKKPALARGPATTRVAASATRRREITGRQALWARYSRAKGAASNAPWSLVSPARPTSRAAMSQRLWRAHQNAPRLRARKRDSVNAEYKKKAVGKRAR